ncbi:hypothetical protein ACFQPC_04905 [Herminiimonas glaciei]|uniref:Uncharacterized protein n=1 Tax=Herminiimonas glaciei TaxID=523788 RepID=A0ABW2I8S8_9BURK
MPITENPAGGYLTGFARREKYGAISARTIWMIAYLILVHGKHFRP